MTQVEILKSAVKEILNKKFNNLKEVGWTFTGFNIIQYKKEQFECYAFLLNFDIYYTSQGFFKDSKSFMIEVFEEDKSDVYKALKEMFVLDKMIVLSNGDSVNISEEIRIWD